MSYREPDSNPEVEIAAIKQVAETKQYAIRLRNELFKEIVNTNMFSIVFTMTAIAIHVIGLMYFHHQWYK